MRIITIETLANILDIKPSTIKIWLDGYRFTKFGTYTLVDRRRKLAFPWTKEFIDSLREFLEVTHHRKQLENLGKFVKNN